TFTNSEPNNMELSIQNIENKLVNNMPNKPVTNQKFYQTHGKKNLQKLHKRLCDLNNKIAQNLTLEDLKLITEDLKLKLQEDNASFRKMTQATIVQGIEENKEGACPLTDNKNTSKQSWAEMMDNDLDNLKDITNATNLWITLSTNETYTEHISTKSDIAHNNSEKTPVGLEGLPDDCFLENISNMEIENAHKPNLYPDHKHENMQTDAALHETQAESNESATNKENKEMEVEPSDSLKDTTEEITYKEKVKTPIFAGTSPDEEMVTKSSNSLRDELANKENLPPVAAKANTSVGDMQANMLSQW
ncbi:10831_t:CDS:2, partial [Gigaspora margarita]